MATGRRGFAAGVAAGVVLGVGMSVAVALAVSSGSVLTAATGVPQPSAPAQSSSKVVFENARVRVKDAIFAPGVKNAMHTHELAHVGVIIQGGTLVFKYPDGKSETMELAQGGAGFRDANVSHEAFNPGKTPVRVIEVELK
jgi:mannose-6-phosphate isomerase-like protein (cupin superfamily)